jgi:hypothetical protein
MQFEPVIQACLEPRVQIGLNPFEPVISNSPLRWIVRHLTVDLTVIRSITARTGEPGFAHAVTLERATAKIRVPLSPKGGVK